MPFPAVSILRFSWNRVCTQVKVYTNTIYISMNKLQYHMLLWLLTIWTVFQFFLCMALTMNYLYYNVTLCRCILFVYTIVQSSLILWNIKNAIWKSLYSDTLIIWKTLRTEVLNSCILVCPMSKEGQHLVIQSLKRMSTLTATCYFL